MILAIETSCDETSAAVLEFQKTNYFPQLKTLSSVVKSQIALHKHMGGVVPETAARAHVKYIRPVVEQALLNAKCYSLNAIDYLAVTTGPGLLPSLMVGVEFAKTLSFATNIPLIPVNHMAGHLYSPFGGKNQKSKIKNQKSLFPMISLIVSGGHTMLVLMPTIGGSASGGKNTTKYKVLGQTLDDAAGEAFDKVAKMLKLPYPGGPVVSRLAEQGNPNAINFPRPMLDKKNYNFSFSGLKTAVLYHIRDNPLTPKTQNSPLPPSLAKEGAGGVANICASFQQAVIDVLVTKTLRAVKEFKAKSVSLSGGVAANKQLREQLMVNCKSLNVTFMVPPINLCTDNAEMIGMTAGFMLNNGFKPKTYKHLTANPNLTL